MDNISGEKRGYLNEDFRIFHLKDGRAPKVEYHYHEFDKLVLLLSGSVTYYMEGEPHVLKPGDLLFVPHGVIHKPIISLEEEYERYVVWTTPDFLRRCGQGLTEPLSACFDRAGPMEGFLRHPEHGQRLELLSRLSEIHEALLSEQFLAPLMAQSLFVCFMISACRIFLSDDKAAKRPLYDPKISGIMSYIDQNLDKDLSVGKISSVFYISRYHLMRRFKEQSGYTLHQYITRRRILRAAALIGEGLPAAKAAETCGYDDYSTFLRAFKSVFHTSPKSFFSLSSKDDIYNE